MSNFADRLRLLTAEAGSVLAFARQAGIADATMRGYVAGTTVPAIDKVARIAERSGVSLLWLVTGEGAMRADPLVAPAPASDNETGLAGPAGPYVHDAGGTVLVPQPDPEYFSADASGMAGALPFSREQLRVLGVDPARCAALVMRGDSMQPTLLHGDLLLVDRSIGRVSSSGIYVIVVNGAAAVKRVHARTDGSLVLASDNRSVYPPEEISAPAVADICVAGRVIWFGRAM